MYCNRVILVVIAIACFSTVTHAQEEKKNTPENFIKQWVDAFNKNDPAKLLAFYDQSKNTELIASIGANLQGYKAIEKMYRGDLKAVSFSDSKAKKIRVRKLDDIVIVTFEHRFKYRVLADDSFWQIHIRTTSVLRLKEKKWKIVHEHSSSIKGVQRATKIESDVELR